MIINCHLYTMAFHVIRSYDHFIQKFSHISGTNDNAHKLKFISVLNTSGNYILIFHRKLQTLILAIRSLSVNQTHQFNVSSKLIDTWYKIKETTGQGLLCLSAMGAEISPIVFLYSWYWNGPLWIQQLLRKDNFFLVYFFGE